MASACTLHDSQCWLCNASEYLWVASASTRGVSMLHSNNLCFLSCEADAAKHKLSCPARYANWSTAWPTHHRADNSPRRPHRPLKATTRPRCRLHLGGLYHPRQAGRPAAAGAGGDAEPGCGGAHGAAQHPHAAGGRLGRPGLVHGAGTSMAPERQGSVGCKDRTAGVDTIPALQTPGLKASFAALPASACKPARP